MFIRRYTMQDDMVLSDDCLAVCTDEIFNTRKAKPEMCGSDRTEKSWVRTNSLKPLLAWQQGDVLTFGGRRFTPRGTAYGTALSSRTGRYLASWSVTVLPYGSGIPAPGMGRGEIHSTYLEIFDVSTGQVLLLASSEELRSVSLGSWFGDRIFVLPYTQWMLRILALTLRACILVLVFSPSCPRNEEIPCIRVVLGNNS